MNEYLNVEIIEEYIRNNGLTKRSFCEQCKISISTLYRILRKKQCYLIFLNKTRIIFFKRLHRRRKKCIIKERNFFV